MSQYEGLESSIEQKLTQIGEKLKRESQQELDLDDRAIQALKDFPVADALEIVSQFEKSNPSNAANKSAFLCGVMKTYKAKMKSADGGVAPSTNSASTIAGGPDDTKIQKLLDDTGYNLNITAGQRRYFNEAWTGPIPGNGATKFCSQIFVGKLPRDSFEDELIPMLNEFGEIYEFRLMFDSSQARNKGYGFCHYTTKEACDKAVKALNNKVFKGHTLGVNISPAKTRLFVGSIPKAKTKEEIVKEFTDLCEGVNDCIVYTDPDQPNDGNRGFTFIDFDTHEQASQAKKKMTNNTIQPFKHTNVPVDWAQAQEDPDEDEMAKVKTLYLSNLPSSCTEEKLTELFGKDKNSQPRTTFKKVTKKKNYAFVFFEERSHELEDSVAEMNGQMMEGQVIKVELAKPQSAEARERKRKMMENHGDMQQGGFMPRGRGRGAMGGRGGRGGGPMGGGYPPYGGGYEAYGYPQSGYGGFYGGHGYGGDASYDATYAGGYQQPPRGGMRGGMRGAAPRGGPPRGAFAPRGAAPRGAPRGRPAMAGVKRPAPGFQQGAGGPPKKNAWEQAAPQQAYAPAGQEYYAQYGQSQW